ncbi:TIGR01620 family protein [Halopseudomonas sp.]|uniref:TIGR01620 family protein n=1 Tax=Halopseudomonas sp. TaxID=2901191 RepID=UPI003564F661
MKTDREKQQDGPRILETWEPEPQQSHSDAQVLEQLEHHAQAKETAAPMPAGIFNAPALSPWPRRLGLLLLSVVIGGAALEWTQWSVAAWAWNPLAGVLTAGLGALIAGAGLLSWRAMRQQRQRLTALEQLRSEMRAALREPSERLALDWLDRLQALHADTPLAERMSRACAGLDQSYTAEEISRRLNTQFYQPLDVLARRLIRHESVGTGMLVATSPWVSVDLILVVWRNIRMMQRVAGCYGLPIGQLGRWRLARHVLRNIALAGGSEMAIGALSDSFLSGLMEKLAARVGQGIGIGLYSSRLGHFTLDLCRAVPLPDKSGLAEDNRGIIQGIRERLGRTTDDRL